MIRRFFLIFSMMMFSSNLWSDTWQDVFNGIQATSQVMNLFSQFNQLRSEYAVTSQQLQIARESIKKDDEWKRWNGLVSLLTQEQKQMVLRFNTMSDEDLRDLWLITRTSQTLTFPAEWLMPTKHESTEKEIVRYLTTKSNAGDYVTYMATLENDERKSIWERTPKNRKKEILNMLERETGKFSIPNSGKYSVYVNIALDVWDNLKVLKEWNAYSKEMKMNQDIQNIKEPSEYVKYSIALNHKERKLFWSKTPKSKKKEIKVYMKERFKNLKITSYEEYESYRNFIEDIWGGIQTKSIWESYRKKS